MGVSPGLWYSIRQLTQRPVDKHSEFDDADSESDSASLDGSPSPEKIPRQNKRRVVSKSSSDEEDFAPAKKKGKGDYLFETDLLLEAHVPSQVWLVEPGSVSARTLQVRLIPVNHCIRVNNYN
jgi:hypothetical protein